MNVSEVNRKAFDFLAGNETFKEYISVCAENASLPHALIIEGEEGSGKHTAARLIVSLFGCRGDKKPCMKCSNCLKIADDSMSDVTWITPQNDRKTIGVESIRLIRNTVFTVPGDMDVKFYIICDASAMTEQAQNALLKTLEEPPAFAYFLLLASSAASLLPTVRSRAPSLRMQVFSDHELAAILVNKNKKAESMSVSDPEAYNRLVRSAGGSVGRALRLLNGASSDKAASETELALECVKLLAYGSKTDLLAYVAPLKLSRESLTEMIKCVCFALRDILAAKKLSADIPTLFFPNQNDAKAFSSAFTTRALLDMYDASVGLYLDLCNVSLNARCSAVCFADSVASAKEKNLYRYNE